MEKDLQSLEDKIRYCTDNKANKEANLLSNQKGDKERELKLKKEKLVELQETKKLAEQNELNRNVFETMELMLAYCSGGPTEAEITKQDEDFEELHKSQVIRKQLLAAPIGGTAPRPSTTPKPPARGVKRTGRNIPTSSPQPLKKKFKTG